MAQLLAVAERTRERIDPRGRPTPRQPRAGPRHVQNLPSHRDTDTALREPSLQVEASFGRTRRLPPARTNRRGIGARGSDIGDRLLWSGGTSQRTRPRGPAPIIGALVPIMLVAIAGSGMANPAIQPSVTAAIHMRLTPTDPVSTAAIVPTSAQVAPLVAPAAPTARSAPSVAGQVMVFGRVNARGYEALDGIVVGFQYADCQQCDRYTAMTDAAGGYRSALPPGRYRAGCTLWRIRAYCLPIGIALKVTLDEPANNVDFEITITSRGRVGVDPGAPALLRTQPGSPRDLRPRIITPFAR